MSEGGHQWHEKDVYNLAFACRELINAECTCHEAYRDRHLVDPSCMYHDIGQIILPLVDRILGDK